MQNLLKIAKVFPKSLLLNLVTFGAMFLIMFCITQLLSAIGWITSWLVLSFIMAILIARGEA